MYHSWLSFLADLSCTKVGDGASDRQGCVLCVCVCTCSPSLPVLSHYGFLLQESMQLWSLLLCSVCRFYLGNSILELGLRKVELETCCSQSQHMVDTQFLSKINMYSQALTVNCIIIICSDYWQSIWGFFSRNRKNGSLLIVLQCRPFVIRISAQVNMYIKRIH